MAIISSKIDFEAKNILRDKKSHLITNNGSVYHHSDCICFSIQIKSIASKFNEGPSFPDPSGSPFVFLPVHHMSFFLLSQDFSLTLGNVLSSRLHDLVDCDSTGVVDSRSPV